MGATELRNCFEPVFFRHDQIGDDQICLRSWIQRESFLAIAGFDDAVPDMFERKLDHLTNIVVVIDEKNTRHSLTRVKNEKGEEAERLRGRIDTWRAKVRIFFRIQR